jgi:hypothetical protein
VLKEYVCGDKGVNCSWGQAINVANRYVYVSQPHKDRVLVISKIQMVVVDVSITITHGLYQCHDTETSPGAHQYHENRNSSLKLNRFIVVLVIIIQIYCISWCVTHIVV